MAIHKVLLIISLNEVISWTAWDSTIKVMLKADIEIAFFIQLGFDICLGRRWIRKGMFVSASHLLWIRLDFLSSNACLFVIWPSQELLERFMEGHVPLEEFLDSFQSHRKTYHIRRAQAEKLQELNKANRKPKKQQEELKREEEHKESRPNGISAHGPPRVFQLRYGLTPAILLPLSSSSASVLSPLDSRSGQPQVSGPCTRHSCPGQPVGLRVIGQLPGWPVRPVRLQQLYRPSPHQPEPPCR